MHFILIPPPYLSPDKRSVRRVVCHQDTLLADCPSIRLFHLDFYHKITRSYNGLFIVCVGVVNPFLPLNARLSNGHKMQEVPIQQTEHGFIFLTRLSS